MAPFNWLSQDPRGLVSAMFGAIISLFFWNGNGFSWQKTGAIAVTALFTGGWSIVLFDRYWNDIIISHVCNAAWGFMASDILSSIKTQAPTITNAAIHFLLRKGRALLGLPPDDTTHEHKPPSNDDTTAPTPPTV